MLITDISSAKELAVVERADLEKIVKEQELALSGLFDEQGAVRIGRLLSAKQIIIGSHIILDAGLRIDAKVVDIESGRVLHAVQSSGGVARLFDVQKDLAVGILKELGVAVPASVSRQETGSIDAARAYYTGIDFLDGGAFENAARSFRQAARFDPYYLKAHKSLEEAYSFLKDFKKQRYQREINGLFRTAAEIKRRLAAPVWMSYADFITDAYKRGLTQAEVQKYTDENPTLLQCATRVQCAWRLQHALLEIADNSLEYFEDTATAEQMHREILHIVAQARTQFPKDPFFPEVLYMELFSLQYFDQWDQVMGSCEFLMKNFPDFRMMYSIEGFYERAIEAKKKAK